jgi:hypothetical protein
MIISALIINTRAIEESDMEVFHKLQAYHSAITFPSEELNSTCPFIWQIPGKDNIEIEDIIKLGSYSSKTLYKISDISYFRYPDNSKEPEENKRYNTLLEMLRDELLDTKIFWIEEYDDSDPSYSYSSPQCFDIYLIGKTKAGNFAGIASPDTFWSLDDIR